MLNKKGIISYFNHIFMCLIPKINKPSKPGDFCIISLCNVNIIIKTIANRIKPLLNNIISSIQSSFKFMMMFNKNVPNYTKDQISKLVLVNEDKYLVIILVFPLMWVDQNGIFLAKFLTELEEKVNGWIDKKLYYARKDICIKDVAQEIPNYAMSILIFPHNLCKDINITIRNYW